jgi:hypothetical protein
MLPRPRRSDFICGGEATLTPSGEAGLGDAAGSCAPAGVRSIAGRRGFAVAPGFLRWLRRFAGIDALPSSSSDKEWFVDRLAERAAGTRHAIR